jgi:hypothetical protein
MPIPCKSHKDIAEYEQENGVKGFHGILNKKQIRITQRKEEKQRSQKG